MYDVTTKMRMRIIRDIGKRNFVHYDDEYSGRGCVKPAIRPIHGFRQRLEPVFGLTNEVL